MQFMFKALHFIAFLYLKIILYFNLDLKALYFIARMNNKKWKVQFYLYQNSLSTQLAESEGFEPSRAFRRLHP